MMAAPAETKAETTKEELPKVVILDWFETGDVEQRVLAGVAEVRCLNIKGDAGESSIAEEKVRDATVVVRYRTPELTRDALAKMRRCKAVVAASVGYDRIDVGAARAQGIAVAHLPAYCTEEVADSALCMLLLLARKTLAFAQMLPTCWPFFGGGSEEEEEEEERSGAHHHHQHPRLPRAMRLRGKTVGIVGLGRIGTAMALRCGSGALGMRVAFFDPFVRDGAEKALGCGMRRCESLAELLEAADVVSVHCNLTSANRHMLDAAALAHCKRGALVVNTARGPLIDEDALVAALRSGAIGGAAIDVLEKEPYTDGHLCGVPNLFITPHAAHYSTESVLERRTAAAQAAADVILGRPLRNVVN